MENGIFFRRTLACLSSMRVWAVLFFLHGLESKEQETTNAPAEPSSCVSIQHKRLFFVFKMFNTVQN